MRIYNPVNIARQFRYVREIATQPNRGLRVEAIQHWANGEPGDSWCMEFVSMVFDIAYQGSPPFPRLQACADLHKLARLRAWTVETPQVGDIVLTVNDAGHAHHVGLVTGTIPLASIAGNTSKDGTSSNGDGVYEREISPARKVFVRVPI